MTTNGNGTHPGAKLDLHRLATQNGYPDPAHNDHTCASCGAPVACEWKKIVEVRTLAKSLHAKAQRLEAKLQGIPMGRQRNRDFTDKEARELLAQLGSLNKVAAELGVSRQTVQRVIDPESLPPSVKARQ